MELLASPLVFISSEEKLASFTEAGKHQMSLSKMVSYIFPEYAVLLFIYVPLWLVEVYPEALVPKKHYKFSFFVL